MEDRSLREFARFWGDDLPRRYRAGIIGLVDARAEFGQLVGWATRHGLMGRERPAA